MKIKMQQANFAHFSYCKPFAVLKYLFRTFDEDFPHAYELNMIYIFFVATHNEINFNSFYISISL